MYFLTKILAKQPPCVSMTTHDASMLLLASRNGFQKAHHSVTTVSEDCSTEMMCCTKIRLK